MKNSIKYILAIATAFSFTSCDEVEFPNEATGTVVEVPEDEVVQRILLEDYTGQGCGNCPGAAVIARQLAAAYGEQLIIVSVHAGYFAEIGQGNIFPTTLSSVPGEAFNDEWGNDAMGNPNGMVNRTEYQGNTVLSTGIWGSAISALINNTPEAEVGIEVGYTSGNPNISVDVTTNFLANLSSTYTLTVLITETDVYDWQLNYAAGGDPQYASGNVEFYKHEHVLRDNISSIWGETVSGSTNIGDSVVHNFTYTLDPTWTPANCSIVAYLSDEGTKEVIQVHEAHVE